MLEGKVWRARQMVHKPSRGGDEDVELGRSAEELLVQLANQLGLLVCERVLASHASNLRELGTSLKR